jgi:glycosidase
VSGGTRVVRKFLGGRTNDGLTLVFDFGMLEYEFSAEYFRKLIENMERQYPHPFMPVYVFGNHDRHRSIERLHGDQQKAKLLHMLQMTVRGVPCMYYGEEIGMRDRKFPFSAAYDPIARKFKRLPRIITDTLGVLINRDEVRTPMQWDGTKNAGFSSAEKTWLPVHENHTAINVDAQDQADNSLLNTIRALLKIRTQEECILQGSLELLPDLPRNILGYCRTYNDQKRLILLNFSSQAEEFFIDHSGPIIKLHEKDEANDRRILLSGISGMILKAN